MLRPVLTVLLACILLVRSLLPSGWMLAAAPDDSDRLTVVICTQHGPQTVSLDPDGAPEDGGQTPAEKLCAFAKIFNVAAAPPAPAIDVPIVYARAVFGGDYENLVAKSVPIGFRARGPPISKS